ncbi:PdaC/SigV domain-containing protein [Fusobacterium sp. PH5-44]|uniref:PdaC/SigV domain-containing protein n=1 Tax=unclassified Fusobacterium TaxID=2648384 RepID=UPI003D256D34
MKKKIFILLLSFGGLFTKASETKSSLNYYDIEIKASNTINKKIIFEGTAIYPYFTNKELEPINKSIQKNVYDFLENAKTSQEYIEYYDMEASVPYTLDISYTLTECKNDYITLLCNYSTYTGGAHGMYSITPITFDKEGKEVTIASLFTPIQKKYINNAISYFIDKRLEFTEKFEFPSDKIIHNYEPNSDHNINTVASYICDNQLKFIFQPYDIGSYAEGTIKFNIELERIKNIK